MLEVTQNKANQWTWKQGFLTVTARPDAHVKLEKFAQRIGMSLEDLLKARIEAEEAMNSAVAKVPDVQAVVRGERQAAFEGRSVTLKSTDDLVAAVRSASEGHLITWKSDAYAIVDVDWHDVDPPPASQITALLGTIAPTPASWWLSRSGGLHMLFGPSEGISGLLWASACAVDAARVFPTANAVEVITKTRRAGNPVPAFQSTGQALAAWRSVVSGGIEGVDEWLEERGMEFGGRYTHDHCVVAPDGKDTNPSVSVLEDGIHCFRCGFRGWGSILATDEITGLVWNMARNWSWYAQVGAILEDSYKGRLTTKVIREAYKCLLSIMHGPDDPRIPMAMMKAQVYRVAGGGWIGRDHKLIAAQVMEKTYHKTFPGPKRFDERGEQLNDDIDTKASYIGTPTLEGIPNLQFIRGARIYGQHLDYPDAHDLYRVQGKATSPFPFVYRESRPSIEELESQLAVHFPGIDFNYLLLCIAARGYAESTPGMPPILLACGNSGSGKTTVPLIAAGLCGEQAAFVPPIEDEARWTECFGEKSREGAIVIQDELFKLPKQAIVRERLIALRREFSYRALYVGPVTRNLDNVVICTGITIPQELLDSEQLGRRAVVVQLKQQALQWHKLGCGPKIDNWRDDADRAELADNIISHICDEFFCEPLDFVSEIAPMLGIPSLREYASAGEGMNFGKVLRKFISALMSKPASDKGRGWRCIERGETSLCGELWSQLCDGQGTEEFGRSEKMQEKPLGELLGVDYPVYFASKRHGSKVFVRFSDTKSTQGKRDFKVTEDIFADTLDDSEKATKV